MEDTVKEFNEFHHGRAVAAYDVCDQDFDVMQAIASFDCDPPDSAFQRGYLRELIKTGV